MAVRVPVRPAMLRWALDRSGMRSDSKRFEQFSRWADGDGQPTFRQLEEFAHAVHAPLGYLFLPEPPVEDVPIPDFRTIGDVPVVGPSPDLLDTIHAAQRRQDWYRDYAVDRHLDRINFVGSLTVDAAAVSSATTVRELLGFSVETRRKFRSSDDALRRLIDAAENLGVLVMVSGIVGGNTHRILDPEEFRGFALSDPWAPLVFINGADTKAAQIFTLVHELAHLWLGESALSDAAMTSTSQNEHERWANQVAAEVLVPLQSLLQEYEGRPTEQEVRRLSLLYRVSTLVILRRFFDARFLDWDVYRERYDAEHARILAVLASRGGSGGNYYNTQPLRISQAFARAVIVDAMEGRTLYRDAFSLLGAAKQSTFEGMASQLGVA